MKMIFIFYFVMKVLLDLEKPFNITILFLLFFINTTSNENLLFSQWCWPQQLKNKVSSSTISSSTNFFTVAPKIKGNTTDPKSSKAPNEMFSSSAELAAHKLSGNSTPSTSTTGTSLQ